MPTITGDVRDIGMTPFDGTMVLRSLALRPAQSGLSVITTSPHRVKVTAGKFTTGEVAAGPAQLFFESVAGFADSIAVTIPDGDAVDLHTILDVEVNWTPPVIDKALRVIADLEAGSVDGRKVIADSVAAANGLRSRVDQSIAATSQIRAWSESGAADAKRAEDAEDASAQSASESAASAVESRAAEGRSAGSATAAKGSEDKAAASATAAKSSEDKAAASATNAKASEDKAAGSATAAKGSEDKAAASASAAKSSADKAKASETNLQNTFDVFGPAMQAAADAAAADAAAAKASADAAKADSESAASTGRVVIDAVASAQTHIATLSELSSNAQLTLDQVADYTTRAEDAAANAENAVAAEITRLKGTVPEAFDTLEEIANELAANQSERAALSNAIAKKADTTAVNSALSTKADKSDLNSYATTTAVNGKVSSAGSTSALWCGTQSQYDSLPAGTKNAAGFVAVIQ